MCIVLKVILFKFFWSGGFVEDGLESVKTRLKGRYIKCDEKYHILIVQSITIELPNGKFRKTSLKLCFPYSPISEDRDTNFVPTKVFYRPSEF